MTLHRPGGHGRGGRPPSSGARVSRYEAAAGTAVDDRPYSDVRDDPDTGSVRAARAPRRAAGPTKATDPTNGAKPTKRRRGTRRRRNPVVSALGRRRKLTAALAVIVVAGIAIAVSGVATGGGAGSGNDAELTAGGAVNPPASANAGRLGATTGQDLRDGDLAAHLPTGIGAAAGSAGGAKKPSPKAPVKKPAAPAAAPRLPAGGNTSNTAGRWSGLPWLSGAWVSTDVTTTPAFGTWRGRPLDLIQAYVPRDAGWNGMVNPGWPVDTVKSFPGRLVLSVPTFPQSGGSNAECATGAYDGYWKQLGSFLVAHGRANTIIRLGWEFNGDWMYWHSDASGAAFKGCYQHAAVALRSTDPQVLMDWTFTAHNTQDPTSNNPYDAYPGDAYVDFVGIDAYDSWPASTNDATWNAQCATVNGLCYAMSFARAHHKKVGVGEWGVVACGTGGTAPDNPFYIQKMYQTFMANRDVMGYDAYFNDPDAGNVCSAIENGQQNPKAAAEYKQLFGG